MKPITLIIAFYLMSCCGKSVLGAVTFEWATVGNPGNAPDTEIMQDGSTGYGSVDYSFRISKHEVTNAQYTEFLNQVAASDPYGLYNTRMGDRTQGGITRSGLPGSYAFSVKADAMGQGPGGSDYSYGNKPVGYVSWYDAIRFANWLHNGQGDGDTETGAYTLGQLDGDGIPLNGSSIVRNPGAKIFLPSEDEWYKAAYHKNDGITGNYWDYPTSTDTAPDDNLPSNDTGNSGNFLGTTGDFRYPHTDVGAYVLSENAYGTFDQAGNVLEWNEALVFSHRSLRGGSLEGEVEVSAASFRFDGSATSESSVGGFRVASIPEPATSLIVGMAILGQLVRRHPRVVF